MKPSLSNGAARVVFRRSKRFFSSSASNSTTKGNEEEVAKFSKLSDSWWDLRHNPLIAMNPVRLEFMTQFLLRQRTQQEQSLSPSTTNEANSSLNIWNGLSVLDVGCGGGLLAESLARLGAKVVALDPSPSLLDMARRHGQLDPKTRDNIDYRCIELSSLLLSDNENTSSAAGAAASFQSTTATPQQPILFDVICMMDVLEHVDNVDAMIQAASKLLKPSSSYDDDDPNSSSSSNSSSTLFVSTINRTFKSHALAIVGAEYIMGYLPTGTHDWNKFLSPHDIGLLMRQSGLVPAQVNGMVLTQPPPPVGTSWDWKLHPNDLDVNWIGAYQLGRVI